MLKKNFSATDAAPGRLTLGSMRQLLPGVMHHPDALPQGNARHWPARNRSSVGRFRHLEVVSSSVPLRLRPDRA
jgi:hypothetical protein